MATTAQIRLFFDDEGGKVVTTDEGFVLHDRAGNEVTLPLRVVLRCLELAEREKLVPELPYEFWDQTMEPENPPELNDLDRQVADELKHLLGKITN
jgi:hypothetical protein